MELEMVMSYGQPWPTHANWASRADPGHLSRGANQPVDQSINWQTSTVIDSLFSITKFHLWHQVAKDKMRVVQLYWVCRCHRNDVTHSLDKQMYLLTRLMDLFNLVCFYFLPHFRPWMHYYFLDRQRNDFSRKICMIRNEKFTYEA